MIDIRQEVGCILKTCASIAKITGECEISAMSIYEKAKERCPDIELSAVCDIIHDSKYHTIMRNNELYVNF